jgi:hypothetical protein
MSLFVFLVACVSILVLLFAYLAVVPWVGYFVIKILTLGKIDLGWRPSDSDSEVTLRIGFIVLLLVAGLIAAVLHK